MHFERRFTAAGTDPYSNLEFRSASSEIRNPDGTIVFRAEKVEVPTILKTVEESAVPSWLWRSVGDDKALAKLPEEERYAGETSAKQVFNRLAGTWT